MSPRSQDHEAAALGDLVNEPAVPQREPMHRGDNPAGRFRGHGRSPHAASGSAEAEGQPVSQGFSAAELGLIDAFLALKGYPPARPADKPAGDGRDVLLSDPGDGRPTIVIAKENEQFSYALFERRGVQEGVMSSGHENVASLPVVLAMIDRPEAF
jgi:hypothetical protein